MLSAFVLTLVRLLQMLWFSLTDWRNLAPLRLITIVVFLPLLFFYLFYCWVGYLLDEILFRGYRKVTIKTPVFVLGIPRSGTTFLHRTLAQDEQYTTFKTWECLFAPSVSHRKIFLFMTWLDDRLGSPLYKLINFTQAKLMSWMDDVHKVSLEEPEEDYFVFLPVLHFFLLVMLLPNDTTLWKMAAFDRDLSASRKRLLLNFYLRNLQKHLYVFGQDKILMSKNASFAAMANSLLNTFPDARFFYCGRDACETLSSQLSSLKPAMSLFHTQGRLPYYSQRFHQQFAYFYRYFVDFDQQTEGACYTLAPMSRFRDQLYDIVADGYQSMGLEMSEDFRLSLQASAEKASRFSSKHQYDLQEYGLDPQRIANEFAFARHLY